MELYNDEKNDDYDCDYDDEKKRDEKKDEGYNYNRIFCALYISIALHDCFFFFFFSFNYCP